MTLTAAELTACLEADRPRLVRLAAGILGDAAEGEDAVQDAAMKALEGAHQFRSEAQVCTWMQAIVVNRCRDLLRRHKTRAGAADALRREQLWASPDYTVNPEQVAIVLETAAGLRRALDGLPPNQRVAVVLHDVEGWPGPAIAAATGWPPGTVKSHLRRGRQALVTVLSGEGSG